MLSHERVRICREREGLTQQQLAARSGMVQSKISRIESGRQRLTADELDALIRALGKTRSQFYRVRASVDQP